MPYEGASLDYVVRSQKCDLIFLWSINGQKKRTYPSQYAQTTSSKKPKLVLIMTS